MRRAIAIGDFLNMSFLGDIFLLKLASDYNLIDNEAIMKKTNYFAFYVYIH